MNEWLLHSPDPNIFLFGKIFYSVLNSQLQKILIHEQLNWLRLHPAVVRKLTIYNPITDYRQIGQHKKKYRAYLSPIGFPVDRPFKSVVKSGKVWP